MTAASPDWQALLGQALRQAGEARRTVELQCRRLKEGDGNEPQRGLRLWADLQMLLIALRRLRRSAELAALAPAATDEVVAAIAAFDRPLPDLWCLENMEAPFERAPVSVADDWTGPVIEWPGGALNVDDAFACAEALHAAMTRHCP
jgi:hypothetical protein